MNVLRRTVAAACLGFLCGGSAIAQESALESAPIPADAKELPSPSSAAFEPEKVPEKGEWSLKDSLKDAPAFLRDATAKLNVRTFYFAQQDAADSQGNDKEKISWALGGSAAVKSGKLFELFSLSSELFTSQKLYGPKDKDGAKLLKPVQESYTVLGVFNPKLEYEGHVITTFRQRLDLPYVNNQDNRMTPNTFENYAYAYIGKGDAPLFQMSTGYLDRIKKRESDDFVSMSEAAGVKGAERGMPWAGARIRPVEGAKVVAVDYYGIDFLNMFYSDAEYAYKLCEDWSLKSSAQFSIQQSVGEDLLTGTNVSGSMWGLQQAVSYRKFMLRAALTVDDKGTTMRSPYGSYPGYNSSIVEDFNRAGEVAWRLGASYDFSEVGLDGVSAYADFIQGDDAVSDDKQPLNDKNETDVNIDYRIKEGLLKNFWLRLRGGFVHEDTVGTTTDFRVIVNYEIPLV